MVVVEKWYSFQSCYSDPIYFLNQHSKGNLKQNHGGDGGSEISFTHDTAKEVSLQTDKVVGDSSGD